jgi:hypothetical protein
MADRSQLLAAALAHAASGRHVFPLWPGGKAPALSQAWQRHATRDPATIERWWTARPYNIGVATGPSRLVVVDLDAPKPARASSGRVATTSTTSTTSQVNGMIDVVDAEPASTTSTTSDTSAPIHGRDVFMAVCARHRQRTPGDTLIVATPSGGWHLYFRHPDTGPVLRNTKGGTARALGPNIDTRGHGGYVVAPPSIIAGRNYRIVRDRPPANLPGWLSELLRNLDTAAVRPAPAGPVQVRLATGTGTDRRAAFLAAALDREADHVRGAAGSAGNAVLWGAAVALGQLVAGGELDETLVTTVLEQAATGGGRRTVAEARATIRSGLRRGRLRPRTVA